MRYFTLWLLLLLAGAAVSQPASPASCTAAIGTPANGSQHYLTVTWSSVGTATSYTLESSTDDATWTTISSGTNVTTYNDDASTQGNVPFYFRVSAVNGSGSSSPTYCTPFPIYTACDTPAIPIVTSASTTTLTVQLVPESPTPNATGTTYAIYCTTTGQYVQPNGVLGASPAWQTMAAWGTITVTGLTTGTSYCFYAEAMNGNGDIRTNVGATLLAVQPFNASSSLYTGFGSTTTLWYSPGTCTGGGMTWQSTGGCSGGTSAGCVGYTASPGQFEGCFLRSPVVNCSGMSSVTMTFDLTNTQSFAGDSIYFSIWSNGNSSYYPPSFPATYLVASGIYLNVVRSCQLMTVVFDLTSIPIADRSSLFFYLNTEFFEFQGTSFDLLFDNMMFNQQPDAECATPSACTAASISSNPANSTICAGNNTSFTIGTSGSVANYQWQVSADGGTSWTNVTNGGVYSNATAATLNITGATAGMNGYEYRDSITGTCGGNAHSLAAFLTINTVPGAVGTITGSVTVCQGQSGVTYSISSVAGATGYTWSLPTGASITSGSNTTSITVTYSGSAASGNIVVTPTNNCGSGTPSSSLAITINQVPPQPGAITGSNNVCANTSQIYSVSSVGGATSYTWTLPSGWTGSSTTNSINVTTGSTSGTISVTANNGCGSSTAQTLPVTVTTIPATPGTISGILTPCAGSAQSYEIDMVTGATSYTWSLPPGWTGSSTVDGIQTTAGSLEGTVSVTANNTCGSSAPATLTITPVTAPATPGTISGSVNVCSGTNQTYSITPVNGATSYIWTLPSGWSGSSATSSINTSAGSTGGTISVTANNNCGNSTAQTLTVTVDQAPTEPGPIQGDTVPCSGSQQVYFVAPDLSAISFTWTLPNGWTGTSAEDNIIVNTGSNSGTISITATNNCGTSAARTLTVITGSIPTEPATITGPNPACEGSTGIYSVTSVNGATSYTWTLPSGWSGTSTTNSIQSGVGTTGGSITVSAGNACGNSTAQTLNVTVTSPLANPGAITGPDSLCSGSTQAYSISPVTGATSYTWTLPSGWTGSSSSNIINVTAGSGTGNISVTANSSCGSTQAQTLTVTAKPLPGILSSITGSTTLCAGDSATYGVSSDAYTDYYDWTLRGGWAGSSTSKSIDTKSGTAGGSVTVTAYNGCGSSATQSLVVVVNPLPQPVLTSSATTICSNDSAHICVTGNFISYVWNTNQTTSCIYAKDAGNYYVTVTDANHCEAQSGHEAIGVYPVSSVSIIVQGDTLSSFGATAYQWFLNDTAIPNANSQAYIARTTGRYWLSIVDTNGCSAVSSPVDLTVTGVTNLMEDGISVYPNPSSGTWQLQAGNEFIGSAIEIYDENGRVVYRSVVSNMHSQIDLYYAASGVYLLKIIPANGNPVVRKLIKTGN